MSIPYGKNIRLTIDGGSHDKYIGAEIFGFPAGIRVDRDSLRAFMQRRAPGRSALATARKEADEVVFLSGLDANDVTTGGILRLRIYNGDAHSSDYKFGDTPRPSHADYAAVMAYGSDVDLRGGGHYSGRLTALTCAAGWLALQYLAECGIRVFAHISSVGWISDLPFDMATVGEAERLALEGMEFPVLDERRGEMMREEILKAKADLDSIGGVIECAVTGVDAGLGEHMFGSVEARISDAMFSVPAVKGVEFGSGFSASTRRGSQNNDPYRTDGERIFTVTNNNGGIIGGLSNGMPIVFRAAFKPTPSIGQEQQTVSISRRENVTLTIGGRHDPCILSRAVPVVEAAAAIAMLDLMLDAPKKAKGLDAARAKIDGCDRQITYALSERMDAAREVGKIKAEGNAPVFVPERENALLKKLDTLTDGLDCVPEVYSAILGISRKAQETIGDKPYLTGFSEKKLVLIGNPLGHSLSPELHAFYADYSYTLRPLPEDELPAFFAARDFDALNVTIPYKKTVIPFLDELSPEAEAVGAVNTIIKSPDGILKGYNTDVFGFAYTLTTLGVTTDHKRVLILGDGGAAAGVRAALAGSGCEVLTFSRRADGVRTLPYDRIGEFIDGAILVNATPLGMYPRVDGCPLAPELIARAGAAADLTYNPCRTTFLCHASRAGIPYVGGMPMLAAQAAKTCSLVTGCEIPSERIDYAVRRLNSGLRRIVLVGMPGAGKSTAAKRLGELLGRPVIDTDQEIIYATGRTPADIIKEDGEDAFRKIETTEIIRASRHPGAIIAVGGGAVTREDNYLPMRRGSVVVRLTRPISELSTVGRPLSQSVGREKLAAIREPFYRAFADVTIEVDNDVNVTVARILDALRAID